MNIYTSDLDRFDIVNNGHYIIQNIIYLYMYMSLKHVQYPKTDEMCMLSFIITIYIYSEFSKASEINRNDILK